ncbi:hypothetical protein C8R44DRAFT_168875 [Mycena epipterygia]|nr:hypothetical protein C8R44DRAFT_168875 [Mycena epipterygia]
MASFLTSARTQVHSPTSVPTTSADGFFSRRTRNPARDPRPGHRFRHFTRILGECPRVIGARRAPSFPRSPDPLDPALAAIFGRYGRAAACCVFCEYGHGHYACLDLGLQLAIAHRVGPCSEILWALRVHEDERRAGLGPDRRRFLPLYSSSRCYCACGGGASRSRASVGGNDSVYDYVVSGLGPRCHGDLGGDGRGRRRRWRTGAQRTKRVVLV